MADHDTHDHTGVTGVPDLSAHTGDTSDAHDASAISVLDTAGNFTATDVEAALAELQDNIDGVSAGGFAGLPAAIVPMGVALSANATPGTATTNGTAQMARSCPVIIPATMRIRTLWVNVSTAGSGSLIWGLYDYSASHSAATEVATGTAAPGGTGWRSIAPASPPTVVGPGAYLLILFNPASNASTMYTSALNGGGSVTTVPMFRAFGTYTWDATPDVVTTWADSSIMWQCWLEGDLDGSGTRL